MEKQAQTGSEESCAFCVGILSAAGIIFLCVLAIFTFADSVNDKLHEAKTYEDMLLLLIEATLLLSAFIAIAIFKCVFAQKLIKDYRGDVDAPESEQVLCCEEISGRCVYYWFVLSSVILIGFGALWIYMLAEMAKDQLREVSTTTKDTLSVLIGLCVVISFLTALLLGISLYRCHGKHSSNNIEEEDNIEQRIMSMSSPSKSKEDYMYV